MLHERLAQGAAEYGDAPCIIEAESGRMLTYAQCFAAVQALRRLLGTDEPHTVVMLLAGGMVSGLAWLATLTGGHTFLPLPPDAKSTERDRAQRLAPPDVLLAERREDAEVFSQPFARVLTRDECEAAIAEALSAPPALAAQLLPPAEGRVCLMTSGSTGEPKGVFLSEAQIAWTADAIRRSHRLTRADRGLTVLPLFHVNAPVVSLCTSILTGGSVVIARRFSRTRFWGWIEQYQVTWASIVPTILAMLLETERPAFLPGRLRFVRTASAPLPVVHLLAFERRFAIPVVETYGLSEAAATVSATPVPPGVRKPGSVGLPVGVELRVCRQRADGDTTSPMVDVARGETGEICVHGPSVIAGYAGGAGAKSFQDGWFRTGDLGYQDEDRYLYITGRLRDVIIRGGENVAPREIEEVLLAEPGMRDVAVVGQPDPLYGQQVVAYIVPKGRWTPEREEALRVYCAEHLSRFKIPETFIPVRVLPRTRSGKIQRHRLQAMVSGGLRASVAASVSAGVTQTLARLRQVTQPITRPVRRAVESSSPRLYVARATPTGSRNGEARRASSSQRHAQVPGVDRTHVAALGANGANGHNGRVALAATPTAASTNGHAPASLAQASPAGKRERRPYIYELDPIRVVTALAVVGVHVLTLTMLLNAAVDAQDVQIGLGSLLHFTRYIFMFTTAFVLVYTYAGTTFDLKSFARKRGVGVVVPYTLWSLLYLVLNRPGLSPVQFVEATVKALVSGDAEYQLYYILLTIQFYLLFPLLLLALPWMRKRVPLVLGVSCALELLLLGVDYAFVQVQPFAGTSLGTFLNNYQDRFVLVYQFFFVLGALAALNVDHVRAFVMRWGPVIAVGLGVALGVFWLNFALGVWWLHQNVYYASSVLQPEIVPFSLLVLAFLGWLACRWVLAGGARSQNGKPRASAFWRTLADASFGIYLVHPLFLSFAIAYLEPHMPSAWPVALRVTLIWGFVAVGSSALSVGVMKTPLLSRLVGRPSSLPAFAKRESHAGAPAHVTVATLAPATVADVYATTPLLPVPASLSTQSPWAPQRPAQERKNAGHGLAITVTASSARHLAPQGATQSAGPRLVGTGTAAGWQRSSQAPSNAYGDAATGGLAPSEPRNGGFHKGAPNNGAPNNGAPNNGAPNDARAGAAPRVARVASALPGPEAAAPGTGWHLEQEYPGSAREHAYAQADSDDLDAARQNGGWLERGPDSREQREARRRRALALREQGWARKDIAAALGVSRSTVSYWFRREFLREREEGMSQDELLESDTDAQSRAAFATDSVSSDDGAQADQLFPRAQSHGESQAPERAYAERASVTANR